MANKFLNGIAVTGAGSFTDQVTIPETPTADAHAASKKYVDDQVPTGVDVAKRIEISVKNISGGQLIKGTVVHAAPSASPPSGNLVEVVAADYDAEANMPAIGILNETLADDAEGVAVMMGAVSGIDTDDFTVGDELYVGADGALTNTKPQTAGQLIQKIAVCVKSHASNGLIKVFGAGRSNDVPLPLYIDNTNQRVGIGTPTPNSVLDVHGSSGQLFSVTDDLSGDLFSVSDISGMPIMTVNSSGLITIDGDLNLGDSNKIQLGASQDLQIYHDGSNSYISEVGAGDLIISADNDLTFKDGSGNIMANMNASNSVELMYGNVKKFETTNTGVQVVGNITMDANATVDGVDISALPTSFAPVNAEQNVQADWNETTTTSDAFILNKPSTFPPSTHNHDGDYIQDGGTTAISDINTIGTESIKHRWNNATTGRPASGQSNEYGTVTTLTYDSSYATQLAWDIDQSNLYARTLSLGDDTGTWVRFAKDGDFVSAANGGTFGGDVTIKHASSPALFFTDDSPDPDNVGKISVSNAYMDYSLDNTNATASSRMRFRLDGANIVEILPNTTYFRQTNLHLQNTAVSNINFRKDAAITAGDDIGKINFGATNDEGTTYPTGGNIIYEGDGTWDLSSINNAPTRMKIQLRNSSGALQNAMMLSSSLNANFYGDLTVAGDLIVSGTTTTLNTQTVEVEDNILQLNTTQGTPDTATAATSGISIYRGVDGNGDAVTQASLIFDEGDDTWDLTNNLTVAGDVIGASFAVPSGASTGFLKADGSVDSTSYSGYNFGATDLSFQGADPGDIVWKAADGTEVHRIWSGSNDYLTYRNDAGTTYELISAGSTSYNNGDWDNAFTHSQATHAPTDAEANVQSDWNATSGDALILNKPTTFAPSAHNHDDRYYTETETNAKFTSTDGTTTGGSDYTFKIDDESNFSGNKWYHVATIPNTNGGLHIRGFISNHVESFASQKFDLAIACREGGSGADIEITGQLDVLHNATSGFDRAGIRVIKTADSSYDEYKVYIRTTRYSMLTLRLTQEGSVTFNTDHSSPLTSEPAGLGVELDTSTTYEGNYVVDNSTIREIYHEGHKPTYSELGSMAYSNLTGTPNTLPPTTSDTFDVFQDNSAVSLHQFNNTLTDVGGNYDATSTGATYATGLHNRFGTHGINTQGDGTYVDIAGLPTIQAVSIWYKAIGNDNGYIVDFRHDNTGNGRSYLYTLAGSDQYISMGNDTTTTNQTGDIWINGVAFTSGSYNFTSGNWYHIVITTNATNTKQTWDQGIRIGNRSDGTSNGNAGYFDQVRTFNRRLTSADVALLYSEVETGATADQTAGEILSLIKTVDGSGSGLDSDKLDGQQGTYYLNYANFTGTPTIPTDFVSAANGGAFSGKLVIKEGQVWDATTQGTTTGSLHIDPESGTDHAGGAITFGASDHNNGQSADAGIYIRSDGNYGTRMYFSTTDSYATGSKTAMYIDNNKDVYFLDDIDVAGQIRIASGLISKQQNTDVDGAEVVGQVASATYTAAFFDYVIKKGANVRAGIVYACHDGSNNVEFSETSTTDLGDTSDVALSVDISSGNMRLIADSATNDWSVKTLIRAI